MKRFLVAAATAGLLVAAPAAPASATTCHDYSCIEDICWDCLDGPHVGCWYVQDVGRICV